ncbi:MAG: hypothetical protein HY423_16245, partial [Candidatus Lambdaproteobacteria bacterium]|nr:hypothetical protein [Candidatus Lambdaproteobacteria bacterium]
MPGYRLRTTLPYALAQDGAWWVARCGLLKSVGQGRTERSAVRNLKDAIALKVQRAIERRRLAGILAGYGFHVVRVGRHVY